MPASAVDSSLQETGWREVLVRRGQTRLARVHSAAAKSGWAAGGRRAGGGRAVGGRRCWRGVATDFSVWAGQAGDGVDYRGDVEWVAAAPVQTEDLEVVDDQQEVLPNATVRHAGSLSFGSGHRHGRSWQQLAGSSGRSCSRRWQETMHAAGGQRAGNIRGRL